MLAFSGLYHVDLPTPRSKRSHGAANSKQDQFGNVPEIESDSASIRSAVLTTLSPNDVAYIPETPALHYLKALGEKRIWNPQVQVSLVGNCLCDCKCADFSDRHGVVSVETPMLRSYLPRAVHEAPRWVGIDGPPAAINLR